MSSCANKYDATDPASMEPALLRRVPDAAGNAAEFLRESATEFFRRSGVWRDQRTTLMVDSSRMRYELPKVAGRIVRIAHVWMQGECGEEKVHQDTEIRETANDDLQRWHQPTPNQITFHRPFDNNMTLRLELVLTIGDDNVGDEGLMAQYREGILAGASHYATMSQNKESSNRTAAVDFYGMFETAIKDAGSVYQQKIGTERRPMSRQHVINRTPNNVEDPNYYDRRY